MKTETDAVDEIHYTRDNHSSSKYKPTVIHGISKQQILLKKSYCVGNSIKAIFIPSPETGDAAAAKPGPSLE